MGSRHCMKLLGQTGLESYNSFWNRIQSKICVEKMLTKLQSILALVFVPSVLAP
jgi:hypothetical protein